MIRYFMLFHRNNRGVDRVKKTYAVLASLMLLAACNGEENTDEVEDVEEEEETEVSVDEETSDEETEDEESEDDTEADEESDEEETEDDESDSADGENQYAGNSYLLSIQHAGQLQPFRELIFEEDTVTLEQEEATFEGTYSVDCKELSYEIVTDKMKIMATLVQNDYEGEIVVEGHVASYEVEADDLTEEDETTIEELKNAVFMMTKSN